MLHHMSMRDDIRAAVADRTPIDARERASLDAFAEHFDRLAEPFSETADPALSGALAQLRSRFERRP